MEAEEITGSDWQQRLDVGLVLDTRCRSAHAPHTVVDLATQKRCVRQWCATTVSGEDWLGMTGSK